MDTAVNRGVSFINGRGWGNPQGWGYPTFQIANVYNLNNGWKQPVITSLYCGTGAFNANPCFGEAWLQAGSPAQPKGAVAFFGASFSTSTRWNNCLDYGIYHGIFNEGITDFGSAMLRGKLEIFENFPMPPDTYYLRVYWYTYNILGDPGLQLWTGAAPRTLGVGVQAPVMIGSCRLSVSTSNQVPGALVSLAQGAATRVVGFTDASGDADMITSPMTGETLFVTVTKPGFAPEERFVVPEPAAVLLAPESHSPDTCNPGEIVNLTVGLHNYGTSQTATGVRVTLRSSDPWVSIGDSLKFFADIAPGATVQGGPFMVTGQPELYGGHRLDFELVIGSDVGGWASGLRLTAAPGRVNYGPAHGCSGTGSGRRHRCYHPKQRFSESDRRLRHARVHQSGHDGRGCPRRIRRNRPG